ncbi:hypothetical protein V494_08531 [Pseudogymnoascus sp. VKM F-4513 (FW-928)]|nr:hypothetical protein V494_08531 [Pseudogymnoascus sp. VKM F-4513 (FW-928)]
MPGWYSSCSGEGLLNGAGPGGIAAARAFMYPKGAFKVTVFEQLSRLGGLWPSNATDKGLINPSMSTNLSKYTVSFSDKTWPETEPSRASPLFPKASDVGQYLQQYADKYLNNPSVELKTSCRVEEASMMEGDVSKPVKWRIRVRKLGNGDKGPSPLEPEDASAGSNANATETEEYFFDHVVISSGFFGKPIIPKAFVNQERASIPIIHSSEFSDLKELLKNNKKGPGKILVVGGSMSGAETSATIAAQISSEIHSPGKSDIESIEQYTLHHITSKPFWTVPFFLPLKTQVDNQKHDGKVINSAPEFLPLDMVMFNLSNRSPEERLKNRSGIVSTEAAQRSHDAFKLFNGGEGAAHAFLPTDKETDAPWLAISDTYSSFAQSGDIKITRGRVKSLADDNASVIVETPSSTDTFDNVSAIIFATGFDSASSLSFLPQSILSTLGYDPSTPDLPLALSLHSTIHPSVPSLGFVGFYRGPYWGVAEQQAALLRTLWRPDASPPPSLSSALENARSTIPALRSCYKETPERLTQFPMGDYTHIMESLREIQGHGPVEAADSYCTPVSPALYATGLQGLGGDEEAIESKEALQLIQQEVDGSRSGKFVAKAIFRSLQGNWVLNRTINSNISTYPSGSLVGTARFYPRRPTAEGFAAEYLYVEDGDFKTDTGMQFRATRRYVYRYAEAEDKLSVWFVKTDNKTVDYLFHELQMISPHPAGGEHTSNSPPGANEQDPKGLVPAMDRRWKATSHHLCIDDTYDPEYEFAFRGVELAKWSVGYHVRGPHKDYWIGSVFTR